eukprot:6184759-Pleurochrysis_carterae.AAC.2
MDKYRMDVEYSGTRYQSEVIRQSMSLNSNQLTCALHSKSRKARTSKSFMMSSRLRLQACPNRRQRSSSPGPPSIRVLIRCPARIVQGRHSEEVLLHVSTKPAAFCSSLRNEPAELSAVPEMSLPAHAEQLPVTASRQSKVKARLHPPTRTRTTPRLRTGGIQRPRG